MLDSNGEPADRNNLNAVKGIRTAAVIMVPFWVLMFALLPWWLVAGLALAAAIILVFFVR